MLYMPFRGSFFFSFVLQSRLNGRRQKLHSPHWIHRGKLLHSQSVFQTSDQESMEEYGWLAWFGLVWLRLPKNSLKFKPRETTAQAKYIRKDSSRGKIKTNKSKKSHNSINEMKDTKKIWKSLHTSPNSIGMFGGECIGPCIRANVSQ